MKLKKRQFARLKDITEGLGGTLRPQLDQLIADIESVQKVKAIQERPLNKTAAFLEVCHRYQQEYYANVLKEGEAMVAASTDTGTEFKGGLRDAVEALLDPNPNDISDFLDDALVLSNKDPKIGDVGYFWDTIGHGVYYGILESIQELSHFPYFPVNHKGNQFKNFSKTPPELK